MGTKTDFEDAVHLYRVTEPTLTIDRLEDMSNGSVSRMTTNDSEALERKHARNDAERLRQVEQWAESVRTHPDEDWGRQVNELVDAQIESARHHDTDTQRRCRSDLDS